MHGLTSSSTGVGARARTCTVGVTTRDGFEGATSVDWSTEPGPRYQAGKNADDQHHRDQNQCTSPRQSVPLVVRAYGVGEDLQRQRGDWLGGRNRPELIAERSEQQRSGLPGDSCDGDERSRCDTRHRSAQYDGQRSPPALVTECECRLAQGVWNNLEHFLSGARDQRNHHRAERDTAGEGREMPNWSYEKFPRENADDDRRQTIQHV